MNPSESPVKQVSQPQISISPVEKEKLTEVYQKAGENKPTFDSLLSRVAKKSGARVLTNYKNPQTTANKVDEKNEEDPSRDYKLDDVNDVVRGRLVYNSLDAMKKGVATLKDNLKHTGITVAKEQDFFKKPADGYRGYHMDLAFPNGQHSEVQLHTPQSYAAAMATHGIHEQFGDMAPQDIAKKTTEVNNAINKLPDQEANVISAVKEAQNAPLQQQAQVAARQMTQPQQEQQGFDIPNMLASQQSPVQQQPTQQQPPYQAAFPPSQGGQGMGQSPATPDMLNVAINYLQRRIDPASISTLQKFSAKVGNTQGKGNFGELGRDVHAMAVDTFGSAAHNWTNPQIKNAFDLVLKGLGGQHGRQ